MGELDQQRQAPQEARRQGDAIAASLLEAGFEQRKPTAYSADLVEIDLWIDTEEIPSIQSTLKPYNLVSYRPQRRTGHRFFLTRTQHGWIKVDAKLRSGEPGKSLIADIWWLAVRQRGLVVALMGADGAGKSTVVESIVSAMPIDVAAVYLGDRRRNPGPVDAPRKPSANPAAKARWRSFAGLPRWLTAMLTNLWSVELAARKGSVVLCDRHPIEAGRLGDEPALIKTMKRALVRMLSPRPDILLLLSAPGEVLYARKGEHSPEYLDRITSVWSEVVADRGGVAIDVDRPLSDVILDVEREIWRRLTPRRTG